MTSPAQDVQTVAADTITAIRRIPRRHCLRPAASDCRVRLFVGDALRGIVTFVQIVLYEMCLVTAACPQRSWDTLFKPQTTESYDIVNNEKVDYGNREMTILLWVLRHNPYVDECVNYLAQFWPSLLENVTDDDFSMQGDVMRVCLAAARGHAAYSFLLQGFRLPCVFNKFVKVLRAIHWLDGGATGRVEYLDIPCSSLRYLRRRVPELDSFITGWHSRRGDVDSESRLLHALLCTA